MSYRRNVHGEQPKFVARITLVKGVPFYGFHVGYRFYLKIYMLNPLVMTRLAELLQQGVIMKHKFQPYEAHLQYLLQFMADYNLYGCGYIESRQACFRAPIPQYIETDPAPQLWNSQTVSRAYITEDATLPRVSHCSIEVDICVQDILNRTDIKERQLHHDFIERRQPLPADMKLVHSMAGLWRDETRRRKRQMNKMPSGGSPFAREGLVSMSADPRNDQGPGWLHEEEYREQIHDLIHSERRQFGGSEVTFDSFVKPVPLEETVNTLLQSVEDLFPENLRSSMGLAPFLPEGDDPRSSIDVDENLVQATEAEDGIFPDDSDEEAPPVSKSQNGNPASTLARVPDEEDSNRGSGSSAASAWKETKQRLLNASKTHVSSSDVQSIDPPPPKGFPRGVYTSRLKSGDLSHIAVPDELRLVAKEYGLVSKVPPGPTLHQPITWSAKRPATAVLQHIQSKRPRVSFSLDTGLERPGDSESPTADPLTVVPSAQPVPEITSDSATATARSQPKKIGGSQTLNFPIVKDPQDPSTRLRLSQQSSSQQSQGSSSYRKQVSLELRPSGQYNSSPEDLVLTRSPASSPGPAELSSSIDIGCSPKDGTQFFVFALPPPSAAHVTTTMQANDLPDVIYQNAYYSKEKDVPLRAREYAGQEFRLQSNTVPYLPAFDETGSSPATFGIETDNSSLRAANEAKHAKNRRECSLKNWEFAQPPPTYTEVEKWWADRQANPESQGPALPIRSDPEMKPYLSQIEGSTPKTKHGFKYSQRKKSTSVQFEAQYMSTMSLEIHVNTRGKLVPDPEEDEVQCIFWCLKSDDVSSSENGTPSELHSGIIAVSEDGVVAKQMRRQTTVEVMEEISELDLFVKMVEIVRTHDPDLLTGYEVHGSSWGYLIERARHKYDYNLCDEFSRMKSQSFGRIGKETDRWGFNTTSTIRVTGRHMINIWRAMRSELNLLQYTLENVTWHLLHRRIPHFSWRTLSDWYLSGKPRDLDKVLRYYLTRARLDIEILDANELVPRTSEQARLLGVDFFSVFSRGSQFKVESIMFRIAKPENFILPSPDRRQVGSQNALECLPLVMEPQSVFYNSPLVVLDFQSLYPSVMIAYNYCYSTFLGRIVNWRGASKMGFADYQRQDRLLELLKDHINIAPNGMMYCKPEIRKSLLAKMLTEILETRVMVKSGMKRDKDDKALQQLLNNRQLALKLLANVTYGYTSASFSGRMPCSEIADSIVQTGRETLERAIALIHSVDKWKAEVVYGDTDSLFIYLPGRTKDQAFDIGNEMAEAVTAMNPRPVKLKFEKVYHPCVLLAKKRYVGYKYESREQSAPEFDAKGIETVRRDGTPAEQMLEEKALRLLFETADLSRVKDYFQAQCRKIMAGAVSIQDFAFAREVKLGAYSDRGPPPPGALLSARRMRADARAEPQYGERVPYVVVAGAPGARLLDRCVAPEDLLAHPHLRLDAEYYITKNLIPPLDRIFSLVGAPVRPWYDEMPKLQRVRRVDWGGGGAAAAAADGTATDGGGGGGGPALKKTTLESYMRAAACHVCSRRLAAPRRSRAGGPSAADADADAGPPICRRCRTAAPASVLRLQTRLAVEERRYAEVLALCRSCAGHAPVDDVPCDSRDCPVFYTRTKQEGRYRTERGLTEPVIQRLVAVVERREALDW